MDPVCVKGSLNPSSDQVDPRRNLWPTGRRIRVTIAVFAALCLTGAHRFALLASPTHSPITSPAVPAPEFDWYAINPSKELNWVPCYSGQKCARLLLPLDYERPDGPQTAIAIRMIPATDKEHYDGTIFLNPGGPGGSGVGYIERRGRDISLIVGSSYDVLSFDPRGIGYTTPQISCFDTKSQRDIWDTQDGHEILAVNGTSAGIFRARAELLGERCEERLGGPDGVARFVNTPNVARDMLEMTQKLGQEKLQYWGFSYGTILGQWFATLYPDKIKRLIIDGVVDGHSYRISGYETDIVDVEAIVESLFTYCHQAGAENCPLYDASVDRIRDRFYKVLKQVEESPVPIALADTPVVITRKALLAQFFRAAYQPLKAFPTVAAVVHALETTNITALIALAPQISNPTTCSCSSDPTRDASQNEAFYAVECADSDPYTFDADIFARFYNTLSEVSPLFAPVWGGSWISCAGWRVRPAWRLTGPVAAPNGTAHPLLLLSTRWDPVTPLAQARRVHARFAGSALVVQESHGHCSISSPSLCTAKIVRKYFKEGVLPEEGTVCGVDELPFVGKVDAARVLSTEDEELSAALGRLSEDVVTFRRPML